ncbi:MAG: phosphopantetheine-binding protein [Pseudonocardiaceae bacterium]
MLGVRAVGRAEAAHVLTGCLLEVLGVSADRIEPERRFTELGLESFGALRLRRQLRELTGVDLPLSTFLGDGCPRSVMEALEAAPAAREPVPVVPRAAYSPELNPDEWVWKNVKHDRVGKTAITSFDDLCDKAESALLRLQPLPELVRAFFGDPCLSYIK